MYDPASNPLVTYKRWASRKLKRVLVWWWDDDTFRELGITRKFVPYVEGPLSRSERASYIRALAYAWFRQSRYGEPETPREIEPRWLTMADFKAVSLQAERFFQEERREEEAATARPEEPPSVTDEWAQLATWVNEDWRGAGGLIGAIQVSLRQQAARVVARRQWEQHGRLPEGAVEVDLTYGPEGTEDLVSTGSAGRLRCVITFPEPPKGKPN